MDSARSGGPPSLLAYRTSWDDVVGMWARSPLIVNGVLHGLASKEVEAPSMPCTISGVGSEWPLWFSSML
jgi:hypothetical protein